VAGTRLPGQAARRLQARCGGYGGRRVAHIFSIQTTGDIYINWDIDQVAETLLEVIYDE
jgi:hypothetical protein